MAAHLIPLVRKLAVTRDVFTVGSRDVLYGCVAPGPHRLLRFDVLCHNVGDADLVVGAPSARPDLFEYSEIDRRYHVRDFVHVSLADEAGARVAEGRKRSFCLIDLERMESRARATPQFTDCNASQGISAGWADVYPARLPCQYVVIDDVPDGTYQLTVEIDVQRVLAEARAPASVTVQLALEGDRVVVLGTAPRPPPDEPPVEPAPPDEPGGSPPIFEPPAVPPPAGTASSPLEGFARDVIDRADTWAAARYLAPGFVGHGLLPFDHGVTAIDAVGYRSLLGDLFASFSGFRTSFGLQLVEGAWVTATWTRSALHVGAYAGIPASGRRVEFRGVSFARVEGGRIAEQWDVIDGGWLAMLGRARSVL